MRIISGSLKGKKINYIKNLNTRPLRDSIKENIFNILSHSKFINTKIEKSNILDLYSGVGSFGIECISRGAKKVTFIENDLKAFGILSENVVNLSILNKTNIMNNRIEKVLNKGPKEKYNIFFLDPPFKDSEFINNLKLLKEKKFFEKNHIIIIHRESKTIDKFENVIEILYTKSYGRSKVIFGNFN